MKNIVEKQVGPELMIYDGDLDSVHILNSAAQVIYRLGREGADAAAIALALRDRFEVPPGQDLEADIRQALQAMGEQGLVSTGPGTPSGGPGEQPR